LILETTTDSAATSKAGTPPGFYVCNEPLQNCFNKMQNLYHPKEIAAIVGELDYLIYLSIILILI